MTNEDICYIYDTNPNMTLRELASITGKTIEDLKKILMGN